MKFWHGFWQRAFDSIIDLAEIRAGVFRLLCNVLLYALRCCSAVVTLIDILELPPAFGTFPHDFPPPL